MGHVCVHEAGVEDRVCSTPWWGVAGHSSGKTSGGRLGFGLSLTVTAHQQFPG